MLVDRPLTPVGVGDDLVNKAVITGLPDILDNGGHQPQSIIRAGIL